MRAYAAWILEEGPNNCVLFNTKTTTSNTLPVFTVLGSGRKKFTMLTVQELCVFKHKGPQSY